MTKDEAKQKGYCNKCAGWNKVRKIHSCGVTTQETANCILPGDVVERWKVEHGLEGVQQRIPAKDAFGSSDYMKKRRGQVGSPWGQSKYKGE